MENRDFSDTPSAPEKCGQRNFEIRNYTDDDLIEAVRLFETCFSVERDRREWPWKFKESISDPQVSFPLAYVDGKLVGMYPGRTLRLQMDGVVRQVFEPLDVCIHPAHRGGTILKALLRRNKTVFGSAGLQFMFGFPTAGHFKFGGRMLGYIELFRLSVWRRPLTRGLRLQARLQNGALRRTAYRTGSVFQELFVLREKPATEYSIDIKEIHRFDSSFDLLWEQVMPRFRFAVVRDAAYLNWRYADAPGHRFRIITAAQNGQIKGYCVIRNDLFRPDGTRTGVLNDLVATDDAVAQRLLAFAFSIMKSVCCGYALALAHPAMLNAAALSSAGFVPENPEEQIIFCIKPYAEGLDIRALREPSNWLLGYGDTDHRG